MIIQSRLTITLKKKKQKQKFPHKWSYIPHSTSHVNNYETPTNSKQTEAEVRKEQESLWQVSCQIHNRVKIGLYDRCIRQSVGEETQYTLHCVCLTQRGHPVQRRRCNAMPRHGEHHYTFMLFAFANTSNGLRQWLEMKQPAILRDSELLQRHNLP